MKHGIYIGPIPQLKAMGALLQDAEGRKNTIMAQFDDFTAQSNRVMLAFGWHAFPREDFRLDSDESVAPE